jgi:uncharacterized protein
MEMRFGFVSTDDHVVESPEIWIRRLSKAKWGDRIPHLERQADGSDCWMVDGTKLPLLGRGSVGALMADRASEPRNWELVPMAAHAPAERLKALDAAGVDYSVLYPSVAGIGGDTFCRVKDAELGLACIQAYNDWLVEEWLGCSRRFIPQCLVPIVSVDAAVAEIKRAVAKGHKGVIFPAVPQLLRDVPNINEPHYDPIWRTCEELNVPICFHAGSAQEMELSPYKGFSPVVAASFEGIARSFTLSSAISNMIISPIPQRFPRLKVVFAESTLGMLPFIMELVDYEFNQYRLKETAGYKLLPSETFRRQCYAIGWYDVAGLRHACRLPGADNIMWAVNLPQATSTWPDSQTSNEVCFKDLPEDARKKILWSNAAALYSL